MFAGQLTHPLLPDVSLYEPAAHGEHTPPSVPVYPTLHRHAPADVDPSEAVFAFAPHPLHAADPVELLYVPVVHALHTAPFLPTNPAGHVHSVAAVRPADNVIEFSAHWSHPADPVNALYCPTLQDTHTPPSGPLNPLLHTHTVDPADAVQELAPHAWHPSDPIDDL